MSDKLAIGVRSSWVRICKMSIRLRISCRFEFQRYPDQPSTRKILAITRMIMLVRKRSE
ncbi:Uncharacterised protein [Vibrio cholerae]|nr:Uncharacterised protein [Vibrio cholerae]